MPKVISNLHEDVTVVRFADSKLVDQRDVNQIASELTGMIEGGGVRKMVVNMADVQYLSSLALAKLISLAKAVKIRNGTLKFCCIPRPISEVLELTRLNAVFDIYGTEMEALGAFPREH